MTAARAWTSTDVTVTCVRFCAILEGVAKPVKNEHLEWDLDREGYTNQTPIVYSPVHTPARKAAHDDHFLSSRAEVRLGSLVAAGGIIWAVYVATVDYNSLWRMQILPPGPIEVCAIGILAWLHAKWRRSTHA